ncbi:ANTAR domain-containing protein [Streptomyces sp. Qhu-G9]|nr:ANTAR domain-containing protein [Streptomyces aurantiacus]WAU86404.1 ANTAR domain-containing protein [Streptomyces aurantiacus]
MCLDWHGPQHESPGNSSLLRGDRLERVDEKVSHTVDSQVAVDRAIGALIAVHGISPAAGLDVLRDVSRRTGTEPLSVAESLMAWALGQPLPEPVRRELEAAVQRHLPGDASDPPR